MLSGRAVARIVGGNLQRTRRSRGLTREQLAASLRRSVASVARWEQGRRLPTVQLLSELCGTLQCEPAQLLPSLKQLGRGTVRRRVPSS